MCALQWERVEAYAPMKVHIRLSYLGGGGRSEVDRIAQDAAEEQAGHGTGDRAGCMQVHMNR